MKFITFLLLFTGSLYCSQPWILTPDSAFENLILKWEGYPVEYNAELPIPPSQRRSARLLYESAAGKGYAVRLKVNSISITVPESDGECFTKELYSYGIIPQWIKIIKD